MSLEKEFDVNNTGIKAKYARIKTVNFDADRGGEDQAHRGFISIELFIDKKSREAGLNPISSINVGLGDNDFCNALRGLVYKKLKTLPEFSGAIDV